MSFYSKGLYIGQITSHGFEVANTKKGPRDTLKVQFDVIAAHEDGDEYSSLPEEDVFGRKITIWMSSDSEAARAIKNLKDYAGWDGKSLKALNGDVLVGNEIQVVCEGADKNGYDTFNFPNQPKGGGTIEGSEAAAASVNSKFARLLKTDKPEKPGGSRRRPAKQKESKTPDVGGDKPPVEDAIPF